MNYIEQRITMAGLSIPEVADRVGVHRSTVNRWVQSESVPTADGAKRLAKVIQRRGEDLSKLTLRIVRAAQARPVSA